MTGTLEQDFEHRALMGASATMTMMGLQELCIFDNEKLRIGVEENTVKEQEDYYGRDKLSHKETSKFRQRMLLQ